MVSRWPALAAILKKQIQITHMLTDHTKHLSFLFTVPNELFSSAVKIITPYTVNVRYTLNYKGEVELNDYNVKPGMAQHIDNWERLEEQMLEAAKNNAKSYNIPNGKGYFKAMPQPGEDPYWDAQMSLKVI